jgi:succinate dehydrogenase / fumarate reductase cytochrome b subunit
MATAVQEAPAERRRAPYPIELYRTAVGKKYVMAITGVIWMGFVLVHMAGNLKIYLGAPEMNHYAEGLRTLGAPFFPRTMRWTGIIVLLFLAWHLSDLTWGFHSVNPDFHRGAVYNNVTSSLGRPVVAIFYIVANLALGVHLLHGAWSLFQSLGVNHPRFNAWRRWFAYAFTIIVIGGNVSFPLAVMTGVIGS